MLDFGNSFNLVPLLSERAREKVSIDYS